MRLKAEHKMPLAEGRLLILSPFAEKSRRVTAETSLARNYFVAALADEIFVTHAAPGGKTEQFCREIQEWGKELHTFESEANNNILSLGR
jgi:predicted Rossmann fold nucleotide-binding protein DprA/Smf involved in DNA uptake